VNVTRWIQFHRRSILFLFAMLAAGGILFAFHLPVSLFPTVDFPRVVVTLDAGDRPAEQMALQVTMPVEEAIRRVPGVKNIRSTTSRGTADVSVNFDWGIDMAAATLQVNAAISQIMPVLPHGTSLETKRMDPTTVFPIIAYSVTSDKLPLARLRDLAEFELRPLLTSIDGVARVQVVGGAQEEYQVMVDPARLQAYGLSIDDVSRALSASNVITAVGRLEDHYKLYLAIADTRLLNAEQIGMTVLKTGGNGLIHLEDVADVRKSVTPQWIKVNADGHDAVLFQIYQQPGANSVQIAKDIRARLASFKNHLPAGVNIANWYDQSELVVNSAASVRDAILIGIVLAALVLYVFLRNIKVTFIALLVVPAVLATTVVLLYVLGMSFNIMTLGGMAAAVGLIIDDAIVVVEHIMRRLHEREMPHHQRVMNAALEFFRPLAGSSAATLVIFVPLAFLSGVTGAFFKALSLTMAASLFISFIITWLAIPILADHWLSEKDTESEREGRLAIRVHSTYETLMKKLLARPLWLLAGILPLLFAGLLAYRAVGTGFMPTMDEGGFILDYRSLPGTSLAETDRLLRQVEGIIKDNPNVDTYSRRTGTQLGGGLTESNEGDFFIRLKHGPRAPSEEVMDQIRTRVEKEVPGLDIELAQLMEDLIGDLIAVPQPIEVKLFSDDQGKLAAMAKKTAAAIGHIPGVVDVRDGINPAGDALEVHVDRVKAALEGVDPDSVTRMLGNLLGGNVTTEIQSGPKMIGVRVWIPPDLRNTDSKLSHLLLRAPDGHLFPLKRVADVVTVSGQPQINRDNLKRMIAVTARISGRDMGSAIRDVKQVMDAPDMPPPGMYYELGGLYQQQQSAFHGLLIVLAAAVALVFLLLLFLYERFQVALSVMAIPIMSLSAVFVALWATDIELNISAMMGMTMIVGIVTEVAIFYFSEYQLLAETMPRKDALVMAGKNRMRPIAMTTLAAILTLLPLALAIGQGSAMQQPLAVAIIAGLIVQFPLVLIVMPVLFDLTQKLKRIEISG
jgi:CzcA family heavy metal efflux pump